MDNYRKLFYVWLTHFTANSFFFSIIIEINLHLFSYVFHHSYLHHLNLKLKNIHVYMAWIVIWYTLDFWSILRLCYSNTYTSTEQHISKKKSFVETNARMQECTFRVLATLYEWRQTNIRISMIFYKQDTMWRHLRIGKNSYAYI